MLSKYDDSEIMGIVNNVKGILHEISYANVENADGDAIFAELFGTTNHPGTDVLLTNIHDGSHEEIQLKATDDIGYVQNWIKDNPDGHIEVTEEIANKLGLESSGFSNEEITFRTEEVVDKLIDTPEDSDIWDYFPTITTISIAIIVYGFWKKYQNKEMTKNEFINKCALVTGIKTAKINAVGYLLYVLLHFRKKSGFIIFPAIEIHLRNLGILTFNSFV